MANDAATRAIRATGLITNQLKQTNMKNLNTNQLNELPAYYIEKVTNNGITYFQEVRRRDGAIIYSNISLQRVAERTFCPTYKDGTRVVL